MKEKETKEKSAAETSPATTNTESDTKPEQLMYVGPTLLSPVHLLNRAVYTGGIPVCARELVKKDADLAACFLPLNEAGKALREIESDAQSSSYVAHFKAVKKRYIKENKNGL